MDEVFTNTSHGFEIKVETGFDFQKSNPLRFHYLFKYQITITNMSERTAQLISRKWTIVDSNDKCDLVEGPGVIGHQPLFAPREKFTYQSFCPLNTMSGRMFGQYFMKDDSDEFFAIDTPVFFFKIPEELLRP
jgi:ApaG protein